MLQLLLEIPNPGGRGRRLVTSASDRDSAANAHARTGSEGPDFLAVEWPAIQRLESQAVRDDADRVMLTGVDTGRLSTDERDFIRDAIRQLRPEISRIVSSIDWSTAGHETVIESAALADLLRGPAFLHLPTRVEVSPTPNRGVMVGPEATTAHWPRRLALGGSAIALVAAAIWLLTLRCAPDREHKPDDSLKVAARDMRCSEQNLRSWINSAQGKPADAPVDDLTSRRVTELAGVARFFAFDKTPDHESQLVTFVESLNPRTADECIAVRVMLHEAHTFLLALQASATEASRCNDWRKKLEARQQDRNDMESEHIRFLASFIDIGNKLSGDGTIMPKPEGPFFGKDDHRKFKHLGTLFETDVRSAMNHTIGRDIYRSDKTAEALYELLRKMPLEQKERMQLVGIGDAAFIRTDCRDFQKLVGHFIGLCDALSCPLRTRQEPEAQPHPLPP